MWNQCNIQKQFVLDLAGAIRVCGVLRAIQVQLESCFCFHVKASISSAIKPSDHCLNVDNVEIDDLGNVLTEGSYADLQRICKKNRWPPLTPDKFESLLMNEKKFTNHQEDAERVAKLYKGFFEAVSTRPELECVPEWVRRWRQNTEAKHRSHQTSQMSPRRHVPVKCAGHFVSETA